MIYHKKEEGVEVQQFVYQVLNYVHEQGGIALEEHARSLLSTRPHSPIPLTTSVTSSNQSYEQDFPPLTPVTSSQGKAKPKRIAPLSSFTQVCSTRHDLVKYVTYKEQLNNLATLYRTLLCNKFVSSNACLVQLITT